MKISYNWLKNYIDLDETKHAPDVLAEVLPLLGFDIESSDQLGPPRLDNVVVGEVLEFEQHPNADRLRCCKVSTGQSEDAPHAIVCGAKNFVAGDRVAVALPGAVLPGDFKIKKSKLRGEPSEGMLCSAKELRVSEDHEGILILDKEIPLGTSINAVFTENDTVFDLEITPNRADMLGHVGVARELAAKFGLRLKYPEIKGSIRKAPETSSSLLKGVTVDAPEACPFYTATCIKGVAVGPSPLWLKKRLRPSACVRSTILSILPITCSTRPASHCTRLTRAKSVMADFAFAMRKRVRKLRHLTKKSVRSRLTWLSWQMRNVLWWLQASWDL